MPLTSGGLRTGGLQTGSLHTGHLGDVEKKRKANAKKSAKKSQADRQAARKQRAADARARDKEDQAKRREIRKDSDFDAFKKRQDAAAEDQQLQEDNQASLAGPGVQQPKEIEGVADQVVGRINRTKLGYYNTAVATTGTVSAARAYVLGFLSTLNGYADTLDANDEHDAADALRAWVTGFDVHSDNLNTFRAWVDASAGMTVEFAESRSKRK